MAAPMGRLERRVLAQRLKKGAKSPNCSLPSVKSLHLNPSERRVLAQRLKKSAKSPNCSPVTSLCEVTDLNPPPPPLSTVPIIPLPLLAPATIRSFWRTSRHRAAPKFFRQRREDGGRRGRQSGRRRAPSRRIWPPSRAFLQDAAKERERRDGGQGGSGQTRRWWWREPGQGVGERSWRLGQICRSYLRVQNHRNRPRRCADHLAPPPHAGGGGCTGGG